MVNCLLTVVGLVAGGRWSSAPDFAHRSAMNRSHVLALGLGLVVLPACFFDACLPGGGGGGSSSTTRITYDLVEARGEWNVTGTATNGSCTSTTTSSKASVSLSSPDLRAATWDLDDGELRASFDVDLVIGARQGTEVCGTSSPSACPSFAEHDQQTSGFFIVSTTPTAVGKDAPGLTVLVPTMTGLLPRDLCDNAQFDVSSRYLRARPLTVDELRSGRFVLEGEGTLPLRAPAYDPDSPSAATVTGALTYSFRFVFQAPDFDPAKAVTPPTLTTFDECVDDVMPTGDDLVAAADAVADGGLDVALNASGCRRIVISRAGDVETISQQRTVGTKFIVEPSPPSLRTEREVVTVFRSVTDATGVHEALDVDEDGFFEVTDDHTFSGGAWQTTVSRDFAANSSTVLRQLTLTRIDATTMNVRLEVGGQLIDEFVTSTRQGACFDSRSPTDPACAGTPPTGCTGAAPTRCSATQKRKTTRDLGDALQKGRDCMKGVGFDSYQPDGKGLTLIATDKLNFLCSSDPCAPFGYFERAGDDKGRHDFMINTARNSPGELAKTLFHEMLHSDPRFTHNDRFDELASKACKLQITDRTYACETMCFAPSRGGACSCTACLNPNRFEKPSQDICNKCSKFGTCPGRQGLRADGTRGNISQGIGAFCARGSGSFCDTKAECDSSCPSSCQPIKTVCDDACN